VAMFPDIKKRLACRVVLREIIGKFGPIHTRHDDIGDDCVRVQLFCGRYGFLCRIGRKRLAASRTQN
jgi:hypothetical protein